MFGNEDELSYRDLAESRAKTINALNSNIDNLNEAYGDLLERFNAREEDLFRTQKEVIIQRHRADNNYDANQDRNKIIAAQKRRIFELESSEKTLKATVNALQRRNPVPHASWEAAYNIEREQKIQAYKDVEALKWENEDLKNSCAKYEQYEKTIADLRKLADTYYNELVARGNKIDDYEKRIIDLRESGQQKTKLIESLNSQIAGLEMDLRIATNDREQWKRYYNTANIQVAEWKKKHLELVDNSQIAFAKVNDLQANVESLQKRFDIEHNALEVMKIDRDGQLNMYKKSETMRLSLLDKVIELEAEINRLSRFEPLEQAELKELEYLRAEYENAKNTIKSQELTYNNLLENSKIIEKENTELYDKYDKLKTGIETLCEANNIRE